jgi:hypothetical protein
MIPSSLPLLLEHRPDHPKTLYILGMFHSNIESTKLISDGYLVRIMLYKSNGKILLFLIPTSAKDLSKIIELPINIKDAH